MKEKPVPRPKPVHQPMPPFNGVESAREWDEFYERQQKTRGRKARTVTVVEITLSPTDDKPKKPREPRKVKRKCK